MGLAKLIYGAARCRVMGHRIMQRASRSFEVPLGSQPFPSNRGFGWFKVEVMFFLPQAARHPDKECNKSPSFVAREGVSVGGLD